MLSEMCRVGYQDLMPDTHNVYKGAMVENYVVSQLRPKYKELYYYKPSEGMEIDLVAMINDSIIPIEIKSGRHKRSTSLNNYIAKYDPEYAIRISELNFGMAGKLKSVPLYAVFCV